MPTLFKRSNGIFYFVQTDASGKRKWLSTGQRTLNSAKAFIRQQDQKDEKHNNGAVSLDTFANEFISYASSVYSSGTVGIYLKSLNNLRRITGNSELKSVSHRHVDSLMVLRLKEVAPPTVSIELRSLKAIFYYALKWKYDEENPFSRVRLPRIDEEIPRFMTKEEIARLIKASNEEWFRALIVVAVMTGMRRSELANLTWADVDFERSLIRIQSKPSFRTKTGKKRLVPMNVAAQSVLKKLALSKVGEVVFNSNGARINPHQHNHTEGGAR